MSQKNIIGEVLFSLSKMAIGGRGKGFDLKKEKQ
jgi:hypothetical protein